MRDEGGTSVAHTAGYVFIVTVSDGARHLPPQEKPALGEQLLFLRFRVLHSTSSVTEHSVFPPYCVNASVQLRNSESVSDPAPVSI